MKTQFKKTIILFFALLICMLGFVACGGSTSSGHLDTTPEDTETVETESIQSPVKEHTWIPIVNTDEFGNKGDKPVAVRCKIVGSFKNTATAGSSLSGYAFVGSTGLVSIRMFEYGSYPVTYTTSESKEIEMKINIGGNVLEPKVAAKAPNSDLIFDEDAFIDCLKNGDDAQFVIYIGSSKYNFTLHGDNFAEEYKALS